MTTTPVPPVHDHEWRLVVVEFEDGRSTRIYACGPCGSERTD